MAGDNDPNAIEKAFIQSWDRMKKHYSTHFLEPRWEWLKPILGLIAELRKRGYDRQFRAGQSLYIFILSRSRRHHLRAEQPCVWIQLHEGGMSISYYETTESPGVGIDVERVELTAEVEDLLQRLLAHPID